MSGSGGPGGRLAGAHGRLGLGRALLVRADAQLREKREALRSFFENHPIHFIVDWSILFIVTLTLRDVAGGVHTALSRTSFVFLLYFKGDYVPIYLFSLSKRGLRPRSGDMGCRAAAADRGGGAAAPSWRRRCGDDDDDGGGIE